MRAAIFWLHIKKSGGMSTRAALAPLYKEVDRSSVPSCFAGRPQNEWNDILNNYRVPLGTYQFRRSDFAKDILYPEDWLDMIRLAFCREPVARALSMYFYLFSRRERGREEMRRALAKLPSPPRRLLWSESYAFSVFLDLLALQNALRRQSIYEPAGLHFATHTNPMSLDVGYCEGATNLSHIYKLENHEAGIDACFAAAGTNRPAESRGHRRNASKRSAFAPDAEQRRKIRELFADDFALYEQAL
jgi:Sulfotransferase family